MQDYRKLGEWLVTHGDLTPSQLDHALLVKSQSTLRLGQILVELGYAAESRVAEALAEQYGLPIAQLALFEDGFETERLLPFDFAIFHHVLVTKITLTAAEIIVADPLDIELMDTLQRMLGVPLRTSVAPRSKLDGLIRKIYNRPLPAAAEPIVPAAFQAQEATPAKKKRRKSKIDAQADKVALLHTYLPDWENSACA